MTGPVETQLIADGAVVDVDPGGRRFPRVALMEPEMRTFVPSKDTCKPETLEAGRASKFAVMTSARAAVFAGLLNKLVSWELVR